MAQIAELSGVSLATVSLVLRDRPGVGPETRQRVLEVARELGYLPPKLSAPYTPPLSSVGLILKADPLDVPQPNKFYSHVVAGIEQACRRQNINLLYATLPVDEDSYPLELPRILTEEDSTDGLLLVGAFVSEALGQVVERHSVPIVLVDAYAVADVYDAVLSDNRAGAYRAVSYLIERGHRQIGLVGYHPNAYPSIEERRDGYRQALADRGIADQYVAECHIINTEEIAQATAELLRRHPHITALFGVNDDVAIAVIETVRQLGRRVPEDLSVVGFDDIDLAGCVSPSLTTLHVDKVGMGRLAIQLLINRAERPEASPVKALICPRLVERQSVCSIG
jgi:DNA-binding LacI/PurR family transcriptional regulator